jgi:methylthioribose-1-phosphate isomerase
MVPALSRYADMLIYDRGRGVVRALDQRAYFEGAAYAELDSVEAVAEAIEASVAGRWAAAYLAGYGLALAARAWAGRPSEARRGALILAAERLRSARPADHRLARLLEVALARADAAILSGAAPVDPLLDFVDAEIARADRATERAGRLAAGLLDEDDRLLAHGFAGPALGWMLAFARQEGKRVELLIARPDGEPENGDLAAQLAAEIGVSAAVLDEPAVARGLEDGSFGVVLFGAERIALDGAILAERGAARLAAHARERGVPRYALGYDGPDPLADASERLRGEHDQRDVVAPDLLSAIITTRGIYRPQMIARYLGDGEAPLDVIPLSLN